MLWFIVKSFSGLFRSTHVTVISCRTSTGRAFGKVAMVSVEVEIRYNGVGTHAMLAAKRGIIYA